MGPCSVVVIWMTDERPTTEISRAQIGVILALDTILQSAGLILACPRCVCEDNDASLRTDNNPLDVQWKIDCRCRRRRIYRGQATQRMLPSGDLLLLVPELLKPLGLDVRCPSRRCVQRPLTMQVTEDGLIVSCQCGRYTFRKTAPTLSH